MAKRKQTTGVGWRIMQRIDGMTRDNGGQILPWRVWNAVVNSIDRAIKAAEKRGYERGHEDGYITGTEEQMKARILDAKAREAR